jgi:uncharacterized protein
MSPKSLPVQIAEAINASNVDLLERLFLNSPEEIHAFTFFAGGRWLHYAASKGKLEVVEKLLAMGADVEALDRSAERTALVDACAFGHFEVVQLLLDRGASLDTTASVSSPLFACIAGYRGSADEPRERFAHIARLLIDRGIDLMACYTQSSMVDMDAAAFAVMWGRSDIAAMVIETTYGHDERLSAGAWAEAIEVALGNAFSREKFRKARYPSRTAKIAGLAPRTGEYWEVA